MRAIGELIRFWRRFTFESNIHPDDELGMGRHVRLITNQTSGGVECFLSQNTSKRRLKCSSRPHVDLTPVPYMGNLRSADIFLLMRNPVLGYADYGTDSCPAFQKALKANICQSKQNGSCLALNPEFWWSSWFLYYEHLLHGAICEYSSQTGKTYLEALKILADRMAILELSPYYSTDSNWLRDKAKELESTRRVKSAADDLKQKAKGGRALVIVRWKPAMWGFESADETEHPSNICFVSSRNGLGHAPELITRFLQLEKCTALGRRVRRPEKPFTLSSPQT